MNVPTAYEIVVQGRPSERLLRPLIDDFTVSIDADGRARLTGVLRDAAHLHGVVAHLTSVNVEIVRLAPLPSDAVPTDSTDHRPTDHRPTDRRPTERSTS
jgi:hypothetical protein